MLRPGKEKGIKGKKSGKMGKGKNERNERKTWDELQRNRMGSVKETEK